MNNWLLLRNYKHNPDYANGSHIESIFLSILTLTDSNYWKLETSRKMQAYKNNCEMMYSYSLLEMISDHV